MARTFDPQHTSRLMILGGTAILVATLLYFIWLRYHTLELPLAGEFGLRLSGLANFGLSAVLLFDLFVFVYENIRSSRTAKSSKG